MAIKKKFPYRAAVVACKNGCGETDKSQCKYGCIGCRRCVDACKFAAISIGEKGVAQVDESKCMACGMCVRKCPRQIIRLHECANYIVVCCSNQEAAKEARQVCQESCIGCGICQKTCTAEAINVIDHCAVIDDDLCLSCGMCAVKCPRHAIVDTRGILTKN